MTTSAPTASWGLLVDQGSRDSSKAKVAKDTFGPLADNKRVDNHCALS